MGDLEEANFQTFRDILSAPLIEKSTTSTVKKPRKRRSSSRRKTGIKPVIPEATDDSNDAAELADFIDVYNS